MRIARIYLSIFLFLLLSAFIVSAQEGLIESFKFKDADIRIVLQAIAQKASREGKKVNIIIAPEVQGIVSLDLEGVDWDTALNVVLKTSGYSQIRLKDVIMVATFEKIKEMEAQGQDRSETRVFKLKYIDANDAKKAVLPLLSGSGKASVLDITGQTGWTFATTGAGGADVGRGTLTRSNILVVSDTLKKLDEISSFLSEIDVMSKQIIIKTRIMEVNRDWIRDFGFQWGTGTTGAEVADPMQPQPFKTGISQMAVHSFAPQSAILPDGWNYNNTGIKLLYKKISGTEFEVIMHALEGDSRTNTLSAPVILTLNNQEANILVGTKYPIINTNVSTETNTVVGGSLEEYKDIGITLRVLPQVWGENEEYINMVIHPAVSTISDFAEVTQGTNTLVKYPVIDSREAETQVVVKDGETIVIGGLLSDIKTKEDVGVPWLKDIPLLGIFFKRHTYKKDKVDLLIFMTAKIVRPGEIIPQEILDTAKVKNELSLNTLRRNVP
ncbi:MAG: hypothetical protein NC914_02225 [Candidatus Omnitrophica bacterium]|nr:hypothetical protein [Candidatus Omnitrophota bacterium]